MAAVLAACSLPPGRLLLLACCLLSVLLLDAACCCLVLLPLIAAGLFIACWLHGCDVSWRVLLLAFGQALSEPLPTLGILSAACGHLHFACRLLPQASCSLLSASRLLLWLWAS
jgi:hypothetical protein